MIFEVQGGCFGYDSVPVLRDIAFSVRDREILSVLGPNGVGKTTLLRCMMGLLRWKKGASTIDGLDLSRLSPREVWRRIAYVPQSKGTALSYTAREMVLMGRSARLGLFAQPSHADEAAAERAMNLVGVTHLADKRCSCMSGGELQMVLIARALSAEPEMLVLDEPESNLDFKNQLIVLETIERLARERGIAAVINTHYPAHALKIADKALILSRDGTSLCGPAEEVLNEENMRSAFDVRVKIADFLFEGFRYRSVIPIATV